MSEPKENEPGDQPQAEAEISQTEAGEPSEAEASEAAGEGDSAKSSADAPAATPKKKKKRAREASEPETIRDRNERVRAEAAEKRRARREREQGSAPRRNLDASEMMDDALARSTHAAAGFLRSHFNKVQWVIMLGLVGWIGWEVYSWRHAREGEKSTNALFKALSAETARVGDAEPAEKGEVADTRRSFATNEERLKAAKSEYQLASTLTSSTSQVLVDLGAAGVAYDLGQYKEAQAFFERVKQHKAYSTDSDIKGRTLEGLGMALEAQKNEDGALKAFHELSNLDVANFAALGLYHEARILNGQGKREEALKKLEKAADKLVLLKDTPAVISYLRVSVMELYESLDANKARELQMKLLPGDLFKQLQAKQPGALPGGALPAPVPAPAPVEDALPPVPGPIQDAPTPEAPAPAPSGAP